MVRVIAVPELIGVTVLPACTANEGAEMTGATVSMVYDDVPIVVLPARSVALTRTLMVRIEVSCWR